MSVKVCKQADCERVLYARELCRKHYDIARRDGVIEMGPRRRNGEPPGKCSEVDCDAEVDRRGLCSSHYRKAGRAGKLGWARCGEDGCDRAVEARGLCVNHYAMKRDSGEIPRIRPLNPCAIDGCDRDEHAFGYCHRHYSSKRVSGEIAAEACKIDGCDRPGTSGRSLCRTHYQRAKAAGEISRVKPPEPCAAEDCNRDSVSLGYCIKHGQRFRKYGTVKVTTWEHTRVIDDEHKTCSVCKKVLHVHAFAHNSLGRLGRSSRCRECIELEHQRREDLMLIRKRGHRARKARERDAETFFISKRDLRRILSSPCFACGAHESITFDHVIPVKRGGRHSVGNALPLCFSCNASKRDKLLVEWLPGRREWLNGRQGGRRVA